MLKKTFLIVFMIIALPIGVWYIGIPDRWLSEKIEAFMHIKNAFSFNERPVDISVSIDNLKKTPLFGLNVSRISIGDGGKVFLSLSDVKGRIDVLSLLLLRLGMRLEGDLLGGRFSGNILLRTDSMDITFDVDSLRIDRIDIQGVDVSSGNNGTLKLRGLLKKGFYNKEASPLQGRVFIEITDMALMDISSEGLYVPISLFNHLRGVLSIKGWRMDIDALSMEGHDIYSRLKGTLLMDSFRGTLEIMPDPDFPAVPLVTLQRYMHTPGYYVIPINTNISELVIQ